MVPVYESSSAGVAAPKSFSDLLGKGVAGSVGILTALAVDYVQKGDDSAFLTATKLLNTVAINQFHLGAAPPYFYVVGLILAGFALAFIMKPDSARSAFIAGAGVLGFLATFSPVSSMSDAQVVTSEAPSAPAPTTTTQPASPTGGPSFQGQGLGGEPAVYRPGANGPGVVRVAAQTLSVRVVVLLPASAGNSVPPLLVRLHDYLSGGTLRLSSGKAERAAGGVRVVFDTSVIPGTPKGNLLANLEARVEAPGYAIASAAAGVTSAGGTTEIDVPLVVSKSPLWMQRTQYPYKW